MASEKAYWGVAKLVKAPDFDSGMRRFESYLPSQNRNRMCCIQASRARAHEAWLDSSN